MTSPGGGRKQSCARQAEGLGVNVDALTLHLPVSLMTTEYGHACGQTPCTAAFGKPQSSSLWRAACRLNSQDGQELTGSSRMSGTLKRSPITATESAPAASTRGAFSKVIPPMATKGLRVARRASPQAFQPDHGIGIVFARRGEDGTKTNVIRRRTVRLNNLAPTLVEHPISLSGPRIRRAISTGSRSGPSEPLRLHSLRHVSPVIDDKSATGVTEELLQLQRKSHRTAGKMHSCHGSG